MITTERLAVYHEIAADLRATGERGSEVAALLVEQLADEQASRYPIATPPVPEVALRIATCWNVLEGIPTEALADGILRDIFAAIDAGDLSAAQALVARFDARVDLTPEGNAHACASCLARDADREVP